ncbi:hypothetical protein Psi02_42480 [Planotetraspora silvatica]|uniref:Uncharacterized protein n=1 Tax=Planotetraspora silvatica TaxID=234614 RepID=A0A8J3XNV3_9ACTN|nr:hypothetical protein [Planotetraspora silvatica]GII47824.1 hypothetical protein Psi02_42480 [Planotetraspora silvatica]
MRDTNAEQMTAWLSDQVNGFEGLAGCVVESWRGVEMAVREHAADGPQFSDPDVPCLQLVQLEATLDGADRRTIDAYQNDAYFGLHLAASTDRHAQQWAGIYRESELSLPIGRINAATVRFEEGVLAEVTLSIGPVTVLLMAAEVDELDSGSLAWHRFDESVLVFPDPADADKIDWTPSR